MNCFFLHYIQKTHGYIHTLYAKDKTVDNFTAQKTLYTGIIPMDISSIYISSMHKKLYWPTLLSIPGEERNLLRLFTYSPAYHLTPLTMVYATESEPLHHNCLLLRRSKGWLKLLGDINQSKYNNLQKTSIERVI